MNSLFIYRQSGLPLSLCFGGKSVAMASNSLAWIRSTVDLDGLKQSLINLLCYRFHVSIGQIHSLNFSCPRITLYHILGGSDPLPKLPSQTSNNTLHPSN
jgi:hypothetical protein